ncbi:MAG: hypothetical protein ACLTRS_18775 [Lachnospiraceae bacterium]
MAVVSGALVGAAVVGALVVGAVVGFVVGLEAGFVSGAFVVFGVFVVLGVVVGFVLVPSQWISLSCLLFLLPLLPSAEAESLASTFPSMDSDALPSSVVLYCDIDSGLNALIGSEMDYRPMV